MDDKLAAALIAAVVSILGSALTTLWQNKFRRNEIEQAQLKDILAKRMEAYPQLWAILQAQVSNWRIEGKRADGVWAAKLYTDINACHARFGVFFSQQVYEAFFEVRNAVHKLAMAYKDDEEVPAEEVAELDLIWSQGRQTPGLAAQLKDDLGSYRSPIISLGQVK